MANLKGSDFTKQSKDIFHRLSGFGEKRHNTNSNKTHSKSLAKKRDTIIKDFTKYAENKGLGGKLNEHFTESNVKEFLDNRTEKMQQSSAEDYTRAFGSLLKGLSKANVDMPLNASNTSVFNNKVAEIKESGTKEVETGRAIKDTDKIISNLYSKKYESGVIAEVQLNLGLRVAEAVELVKNADTYIKDNSVVGLVGKGNHTYIDKNISIELEAKIKECDNNISLRTYQSHLAEQDIRSHDFRYTFVANNKDTLTKAELSTELNHKRKEITDRYIARL